MQIDCVPGGHFSDTGIVFYDWMPDVSIAAKAENKQSHANTHTHTHTPKAKQKPLPPDISDWISNQLSIPTEILFRVWSV